MLVGATQAKAQTNYGLQINEVDVTSENCNDLSVIDGVSGTVKYAPETKTLYLENATIAAVSYGITNVSIDGLTINVTGENKITTAKSGIIAWNAVVHLGENSTIIKGGGTLNIDTKYVISIYFKKSLEIDSCTVNAKGDDGITGVPGTSALTIRNANVTSECYNGLAIRDLASLTLDGCKITTPEGASFYEKLHAVMVNGASKTRKVIITPDQPVGIKDVKASVPAHKQGFYSIDGVYFGNDFNALPKGIYINDGKKVLK